MNVAHGIVQCCRPRFLFLQQETFLLILQVERFMEDTEKERSREHSGVVGNDSSNFAKRIEREQTSNLVLGSVEHQFWNRNS